MPAARAVAPHSHVLLWAVLAPLWAVLAPLACGSDDSASGERAASLGVPVRADQATRRADAAPAAPPTAEGGATLPDAAPAGEPEDDPSSPPGSGCSRPAALAASPQTIEELVALVNALPKPLSLPCFLQLLERPLSVVATESAFSAQPSVGRRSPRVFLFSGPLVLSIVADGEPSRLLEMGEQTAPGRSIKAELEFPVATEVRAESPFERLILSNLTTCGACHDHERKVLGIEGAAESEILRPTEASLVPLAELRGLQASCDPEREARRCAIFDSLLSHGDILEARFDPTLPTIFE